MPWFRVDDTLDLHPKVLAAGNAAMGLWVRSGSWASRTLTEGFVPVGVAKMLGTPALARQLVAAGLWFEVPGGYQFHQWNERQLSREQVEQRRESATERQRRARDRAQTSRRDSRDGHAVSHAPPSPALPCPSVERLLPQPCVELRDRLAERLLTASWSKATDEQIAEITALVEAHGVGRLVEAAVLAHQPDAPARFVQAWLGLWREMRPPRRHVPGRRCPEHGLELGSNGTCLSCEADRKAAG